jgi:hypothetical protein
MLINRVIAVEISPLNIELMIRMPKIEGLPETLRFGLSRILYSDILDPEERNFSFAVLDENVQLSKETPLNYGYYCSSSSMINFVDVTYHHY